MVPIFWTSTLAAGWPWLPLDWLRCCCCLRFSPECQDHNGIRCNEWSVRMYNFAKLYWNDCYLSNFSIYRWSFPLARSSKNCFSLPGVKMSLKSGNRYMWRNESIAMSGRSLCDFPKWCNGWAKRFPSAVRKLMFSVIGMWIWNIADLEHSYGSDSRFSVINCCSTIVL